MQKRWTVTAGGEPISWEISEDSSVLSIEWFGRRKELKIVVTTEDWTYFFQKTQVKTLGVDRLVRAFGDELFRSPVHAAMKKQLLEE